MASDDLGKLVSDLTTDLVLGAGKDTAVALVRVVIERRRKNASAILLQELRKGKIPLSPPDEIVSSVLRYIRAADEGAARLNLRLMAQVFAGKAFLGNLKADEFLHYAEILSAMRREELVLVATLQKVRKANLAAEPHVQWKLAVEALVPTLFEDEQAVRATALGCLRTGLLMDENTMDNMGNYVTSPLMDALERLAPIEAALEEDSTG